MADQPNFEGLEGRKLRKAKFAWKLEQFSTQFPAIMVCGIDHVGSHQMQQVRIGLRGTAQILCGKNTMMRRLMSNLVESGKCPNLASLLEGDIIKYNVALVFTTLEKLAEVRTLIESNQVPAAAKTGVVAPVDVMLPAGSTGLDPGQTAFFQAANIATKISKGAIELLNPVTLVSKGERVSSTAVALLTKMNIRPFFFGIKVKIVYEDGFVYDAKVLDLTNDDLLNKFFNGASYVACVSLAAQYPTLASLVHSMSRGFQKCAALALATDYTFEEVKEMKALLADPEALAKAQAAAASAGAATGGDAAPAAEEAPAEEEEEEEEAGAMDLFGGEGGDY